MWVDYKYNCKRNKTIALNRLIYFLVHKDKFDQTKFIDHIDRNRFNNHISNLREATNTQNQFNTGPSSRSKTGYKGVSINTARGQFKVGLKNHPNKDVHIGYFNDLREAVIAYNEAALKYHGEFAYLNPIPEN